MSFSQRRKKKPKRQQKRLIKTLRPSKTWHPDLIHHPWTDLYHWLLIISWPQLLLLISLCYLAVNTLFATAYLITGNGIANAKPGSFTDAFFFSIQTLSTIGYGAMYPQTLLANILMTLEVLVALVFLTILTGLMFARFSRPTARVMFSRVAVICPDNGIPTLMFRTANQRENQILEAQVQVILLRDEITSEGHQLRRFYDLKLLRSQTPIFWLSWLVMHPIDETSPFYGETLESLAQSQCEIWVTLTGLDETFSQTIHARYSYTLATILWNMRFVDIFSQTAEGQRYIDFAHFHEVIPV